MSAVFRAALAAALVVLASCGGGDGGARVDGAWARATPGAVTNGAIYLEITAPGGDALTGVAVGVARTFYQRKAAAYYRESAGHLPEELVEEPV